MESYWILGAGRFGSLAVARILERKRDSSLLVVDRDSQVLKNLGADEVETVEQDAIEFLLEHQGFGHEWIVPAIPVHVAFAWLCHHLDKEGKATPLPVPSILDHQVPNPLRDKTGALYASLADFRCPDHCEEQAERCTVTGKRREANMFDVIGQIKVEGYITRVVRSHQLAPGVGGYKLSVLWSLLETVRSTGENSLVSTACRCHGVINALHYHRIVQSA
jgi:hypothetical protein